MKISFEQVKKNIARERARKLLRWPPVYALGQVMVRRNLIKFPYRATAMMVEYGLEQTGKAYSRSFPSVWTSAFFPTELLYALNITPFSPEVAAALVAALGFQGNFLQEAESRWWSRDNCSFHRCAMGGLFTKYYPLPGAFCASSHLCDGAVFLFRNLAQHFERSFLLLDTPLQHDEDSLRYVMAQLEEIIVQLQRIFATTLKTGKLEESVANAEKARRAMLKVNELRLDPDCPFTAQEAFNHLYLYFTGLGSEAMPRIYETLAQELAEKIEAAGEPKKTPRYKL
ncbi:MAG: 2-hydroxyacyl-CoA dehydratase, partial [Dethiobacteria bacterium]